MIYRKMKKDYLLKLTYSSLAAYFIVVCFILWEWLVNTVFNNLFKFFWSVFNILRLKLRKNIKVYTFFTLFYLIPNQNPSIDVKPDQKSINELESWQDRIYLIKTILKNVLITNFKSGFFIS